MNQPAETVLFGVRNFRDVGGLPTTDGRQVARGLLFRSGHLAHATERDTAFLTSLGLRTVFDFRNEADRALDGPDVALPGTRNVHIPLTDPANAVEFWRTVQRGELAELRATLGDGRGAAWMVGTYRDIVRDRTAEHSQVLHALAEDSVPALLHCAAGKDRAGVTMAVVLLALGVERDAIVDDYLASNAPHRRYRVRRGGQPEEALPDEVRELLAPLFDARVEYLAAAFETIEETWGSVDTYLADGLRLTPATRERLRARLLAPR